MPLFAKNLIVPGTVGLVLSEREANYYDDSDFYATVWNLEKGEPQEVIWGTTRGAMGPSHGYNCVVDATP